MAQHYGIVVRKDADGTFVPFDHDPSEEAATHRAAIMGWLTEQGHVIENVVAAKSPTRGHHVILHSGPLVK